MGLSRKDLLKIAGDDLPSATDIEDLYKDKDTFTLNGRELPIARMTAADEATWDNPSDFSELESSPHWVAGRPAVTPSDPRIDHTGIQTRVRDQIDRLTCASFATLAAMEANLKAQGVVLDLSEQHVNFVVDGDQCSDVVEILHVAEALLREPICTEGFYPYEDRFKVTLDCLQTPPANAISEAKYSIDSFREIPNLGLTGPSIANTGYLESLLFQGYDIVFETEAAYDPTGPGIQDVRRDPLGPGVFRTGKKHAMVIVGYDRTGAKPFFICKNSYGSSIGH